MKNYYKIVKLFIKTPQIILTYLLLFGMTNFYMYKLLNDFLAELKEKQALSTDSLYFYGDIRFLCIVFFICWFFIAFEFANKFEILNEVFKTMGKRSIIPYISQWCVLLLAIIVITVNVSVYAIVGYYQLGYSTSILPQMVKVLFYDVFLLSAASAGMGGLVAGVKRKFIGYVIFLLLIVIMMPDYYDILRELLPIGVKMVEKIHSIVCFLPQDINYTYDTLYGLPFESYRFFGMILWIILGGLTLIRVYNIKQKMLKKVVACIYGGVVLVLLILVLDRGSVLRMDDNLREIASYYAEHTSKEEGVDYKVLKYQMDFKIQNQLSTECKLELGGNIDQNKYIFTLYHGFKVKYIKDADEQTMNFKQEGDYITVYTDKPTNSLTFCYSGNGGLFYANKNACFLPGFFPYYPKAGFVKVFDTDNLVFISNREENTQFDIGIDHPKKFVTNLSEHNGRFKGTAENLLIITGYYEKIEDGGNEYVVLPLQKSSYKLVNEYKNRRVQEQFERLMAYLGDKDITIHENLPCVVMPNSTTFSTHLQGCYVTNSYMLISEQTSAYSILEEKISKEKHGELKKIFFELRLDEEYDLQDAKYHKNYMDVENYTICDELYDTILDKMKINGVQKTAQIIYHYIMSDEYKGNIEEDLIFIKAIG